MATKSTQADQWRLAYEAERDRVTTLLDALLALQLRLAGPAPSTKGARVLEDVEEQAVARAEGIAVKRAEKEFVQRAAADLIQKGSDPVVAEREAKTLWQAATDFHPESG